jgi:hypothetical protein
MPGRKRERIEIVQGLAFQLSQRLGEAQFRTKNESDRDVIRKLQERAESLYQDISALPPSAL